MAKHILLVEPDYYTRYPPIGLLKLSTYQKEKGNSVELIRGCNFPEKTPDEIYITSLFTWTWKSVWKAVRYYKMWYPKAETYLGGIYASLMPDHARLSGVDNIQKGIYSPAEDLMPDYELRPDWDGSIIFSSRGCNRSCGFCAVPKIEGKINSTKTSIKPFIYEKHTRIIFFDNNFLWNPHKDSIFDELLQLGKKVDFNQGLDARLITDDIAEKLSKLTFDSSAGIRIAYDTKNERDKVQKAIERLSEYGINKRRIFTYALFNYNDTPEEFLERLLNILNWGAVCYPMRYEPLTALEKNQYISPNWTLKQVDSVQAARRVIGYGGAFPPYKALVEKFEKARDFDQAFELREPNKGDC